MKLESIYAEYNDYLERHGYSYPQYRPQSFQGFLEACEAWDREYDGLWEEIDRRPSAWRRIQALERMVGA